MLFSKRNLGAFLIALAGLIFIGLLALGFSSFGIDNIPASDITLITAYLWILIVVVVLLIIIILINKGYNMVWNSYGTP